MAELPLPGVAPVEPEPDPFADPAAGPDRTVAPGALRTPEQHERACPFSICVCDHLVCREGWLDEDEPAPTKWDRHAVRSRRCPRCNDARIMHAELNPPRGVPGRRKP